jgi:retinol dehydrogenase-12
MCKGGRQQLDFRRAEYLQRQSCKSRHPQIQLRIETRVEVWNLNQGFIKSVNAFGKRVQGLPRLGVAILNAAIFKFDWSTSPETGIESSLQGNHLTTALLTLYLLPILGKTSRELKQPTGLAATSSEVALWTPFKEQKLERILDCLNDQEYFGSDRLTT